MKGYYTDYGYMSLVNDRWILFATDSDAQEYIEAQE